MAIHFVDPSAVGSADNVVGNQGHTLDLPWDTVEFALESGELIAGDTIAVRRTHSEIPGSDIEPGYSGSVNNPIKIFGCPRSAHVITSASCTNGDTTIDNVLPADLTRESHQARYWTGPDGESYFIERIVDANTMILDREYAGTSVTLLDGASSINADNVQADWDNYDDSADTIKKADWESNSDDLPVIDFDDGAFQIYIYNDNYLQFENMEFKDSSDGNGIIYCRLSFRTSFIGCLFKQSANNSAVLGSYGTNVYMERTTLEGSGAGSSQVGILTPSYQPGFLHMKDCAIYNMGDRGVSIPYGFFENVNIGVAIENGDDDIAIQFGSIYGRDIKLGGNNGYVLMSGYSTNITKVEIENFQKILGAHRTYFSGGIFEKSAVTGETPNKKVSDYIETITPSINSAPIEDCAYPVLVHEIEVTAVAHTLKYWVYNEMGVTINDGDAKGDVYLKAEYIKEYDDTSEYVVAEIFSAENTIAVPDDADDWDSLSVTFTPAIASKVRLTIYLRSYSATGLIHIDPAVVIT